MTDPHPLEARLVELETRLALQDETLRDLSDVATAQWEKIDLLIRRIEALDERLAQRDDEIRDPAEDGPPPHY